jgi:SAM-dependent methyltransferase
MKLSELIAFRNRLEELPVNAAEQAATYKLDILMHTVNHPHEQSMVQLTQPFMPALEAKLKEIHAAFDDFSIGVEQVKKHVRDQIAEQEKHWFQESYSLFESAELCEKTDQILYGRKVTGTKSKETIESEDTLCARLSTYADWRWPGMIIRPATEDFIEKMVGCDPLYIIDREHDLLEPCLKRFPKLYQNRLRLYTTNDWSDQPILEKIPTDQFGVCLAYNVFNHRPLEIIRRYLEEIYTKLRPGGALLMTYNDCDRAQAVMLVEQFCASYTPGYLIRNLAQNIGFNLVHTWSDGGPSVWLELRKPGQLISKRGGQALAKIHNIFDYSDDIDFLKRKAYTNDEVRDLQERARFLSISEKSIKRNKPYDLSVLIKDTEDKIKEEQRIKNWREVAVKHNIELSLPNWQDLVKEILDRETEEQNRIREQQYLQRLKEIAILQNVDINSANWKETLEELLRKQALEEELERLHKLAKTHNVDINSANWKETLEELLRKQALEEKRRIEKEELERLHELAKTHNVDITAVDWKSTLHKTIQEKELERERIAKELHEELAKSVDQRKREELVRLRQRAKELQAGDPNLIRYGYSAEKLKNLIKQKEEENK